MGPLRPSPFTLEVCRSRLRADHSCIGRETTNPLIILTYRVISSVISIRGFEARISWPTDFCDATDSKKSNLKKALIWSLRRIMLSFLHQLYTGWDHGGAVFPVVKVAISTAGHGLLFSCGSGGTWQGVTIEFPEKALNGLDVWQSQRWPFQQPFLQTSMVCYGGVARGTAPCGEGWREWLWVPCCFITESNQKSISGNQLKALSRFIVFSSLYLILNVVRMAKSGWNYSKTTPAISQTDWLKCFGGASRRNPLKYHRNWRRIPTLSQPKELAAAR